MLSFNKLGKSGRLGNQMFQYAALRGIAANRGFDWVVPPPGTSGVDEFGCENNYCMFEKPNGKIPRQSYFDGSARNPSCSN